MLGVEAWTLEVVLPGGAAGILRQGALPDDVGDPIVVRQTAMDREALATSTIGLSLYVLQSRFGAA